MTGWVKHKCPGFLCMFLLACAQRSWLRACKGSTGPCPEIWRHVLKERRVLQHIWKNVIPLWQTTSWKKHAVWSENHFRFDFFFERNVAHIQGPCFKTMKHRQKNVALSVRGCYMKICHNVPQECLDPLNDDLRQHAIVRSMWFQLLNHVLALVFTRTTCSFQNTIHTRVWRGGLCQEDAVLLGDKQFRLSISSVVSICSCWHNLAAGNGCISGNVEAYRASNRSKICLVNLWHSRLGARWFGLNYPFASLCAFCRVVVPTKSFTNTAFFTTKCCLNQNQPPLLQNVLGVLMVDTKPMWVITKCICAIFLHYWTKSAGTK